MVVVGNRVSSAGHAGDRHVLRYDHRNPDQGELRYWTLVGRIHLLRLSRGGSVPENTEQIEHPVGEPRMIQMVHDDLGRGCLTVLHGRRDAGRTSADPRMPITHVALPCPSNEEGAGWAPS